MNGLNEINVTLQKGFVMLAETLENGFSGLAATMTENNAAQNQKLDTLQHQLKRIASKVNE